VAAPRLSDNEWLYLAHAVNYARAEIDYAGGLTTSDDVWRALVGLREQAWRMTGTEILRLYNRLYDNARHIHDRKSQEEIFTQPVRCEQCQNNKN
jgi:hypothetical protein